MLITAVLSAANLSDAAFWTPAGLCVRGTSPHAGANRDSVSTSDAALSQATEADAPIPIPELSAPPQPTSSGTILPVPPAGWSTGQAVRFEDLTGLIREISVDADNTAGPWKMELLVR